MLPVTFACVCNTQRPVTVVLEMPWNVHVVYALSGWFTDVVISEIAQQTGSEYTALAIELDFTKARLDQICHRYRHTDIVDITQDLLMVTPNCNSIRHA